jgi:hypothetical protein
MRRVFKVIDREIEASDAERAGALRRQAEYMTAVDKFSQRYPFTPLGRMYRRLSGMFGIRYASEFLDDDDDLLREPDDPLYYEIVPETVSMAGRPGWTVCRASIVRASDPERPVLHRAEAFVKLADQDIEREFLIEEVTGVDAWALEDILVDYLVLADIFRWAERTLVPVGAR